MDLISGDALQAELRRGEAFDTPRAFVSLTGDFEFSSVRRGKYELVITNLYGSEVHRQSISIPLGNKDILVTLGTRSVDPTSAEVVSIQRLQRRIPRPAESEYNLALKAMTTEATKEAQAHLRKALSEYPEYAEAHNWLGICFTAEKQMDKALGEFQIAAALDPGSASANYNLSVALFTLKRYPEAESAVRRCLRLNPAHDGARYLLGLCLYEQHKNGKETLENLRRVADEYPRARLTLARIMADKGLNSEAAAELKGYLSSSDQTVDRRAVELWMADLQSPAAMKPSNQQVSLSPAHD